MCCDGNSSAGLCRLSPRRIFVPNESRRRRFATNMGSLVHGRPSAGQTIQRELRSEQGGECHGWVPTFRVHLVPGYRARAKAPQPCRPSLSVLLDVIPVYHGTDSTFVSWSLHLTHQLVPRYRPAQTSCRQSHPSAPTPSRGCLRTVTPRWIYWTPPDCNAQKAALYVVSTCPREAGSLSAEDVAG